MAADIQFNVDAALAKLGELVAQHGPQAVDTAAHVVQINAIDTLTGLPGYGALAIGCAWAAKAAFRRCAAIQDAYDDLPKIGWGVSGGVASLATAGFAWSALATLFNVWAWVALFNPKLALAHAILAKLGGL